ncbi:MAG: S-adenosylmethionine decarboxylase [Candidatus Micrarchaeota archaeon]|nr:S-adenosylmethionine decarboxylase [Candidatus Micrarchaeota archaeon]
MKDLAPEIYRQRLLIEAKYDCEVDKQKILDYFNGIAKELDTKIYGEPTVHSTDGTGKYINQGYDAFAPLIDSGISVYIWTNAKFLSVLIYTCKKFEPKKALVFTKKFFNIKEIETIEF